MSHNDKSELADMHDSLKSVQQHINLLNGINFRDVKELLGDNDAAKFDVSLAYTCYSLLFMLANLDRRNHGNILLELDRVKDYISRIKAGENLPAKRVLTIDKLAASRLIQFELLGKREE